jgi:hypothetical protein
MLTRVAVTDDGLVDPLCRRAERLATAKAEGGITVDRKEPAVAWGTLREFGWARAHHARGARLLRQRGLATAVARYVSNSVRHMSRSVLEALA